MRFGVIWSSSPTYVQFTKDKWETVKKIYGVVLFGRFMGLVLHCPSTEWKSGEYYLEQAVAEAAKKEDE